MSSGPGDSPDLSNLQESFSKQQAKINALKEMVKKSESNTSAHEMAKNIAEKLSNLKTKAKSRQSLNKSINDLHQTADVPDISLITSTPPPIRRESAGTPGSQKMELLKQQMEANRQKLAERKNSKKEIEEMVSQLRANFSSAQQSLEHSSELGRSMGDLSSLSYTPGKSKVKSTTDLSFTPLNLDKERIKFLENRIRHLEKQQEKVVSSPDEIVALQKRIQELEESLSEKEDLENDNQVQTLQARIKELEETLSNQEDNQIKDLKFQLEERLKEIEHLKTGDNIEIEDLRYQLDEKIHQIESLKHQSGSQEEIDSLRALLDQKEHDIQELKKLKEKIQVQAVTTIFDDEMEQQLRDEMEDLKQKLEKSADENESLVKENKELKEVNDMLETLRCDLKVKNSELEEKIVQMEESQRFEIVTKEEVETTQIGDEFMSKIRELESKIQLLEQENEELKGSQNLSQISDENAVDAIKEMESTLDQQRQKIQSLEDQLAEKVIECNVLNANFSVLEEKLKSTATPKTLFPSADEASDAEIVKLKTQLDEVNKSMIKMKVKSKQQQKQIDNFKKMSSANDEIIKLNEEIEKLQGKIKELESSQIESIDIDEVEINALKEKISQLTAENAELHHKLSDKASSSGESIEIVERLTQQECLEIEAFNKGLEKAPEIGEELNDSLVKLREESSELNDRIELFTNERRELLEKMDALSIENAEHLKKINALISEKAEVEEKCLETCERVSFLEEQLQKTIDEKDGISSELKSTLDEKRKIQDELNTLKREGRIKPSDEWKSLVKQAETNLTNLSTELDAFSKAKDKKSAAKKFNKEVKNSQQQFSNVLEKIKKDLERGSETDDEIENLKEKIDMLSKEVEERQGYARIIEELKEEIQNLKSQDEAKCKEHLSQISSLQSELDELRSQEPPTSKEEIIDLNDKIKSLQSELDDLRNQPVENHEEELQELRQEIYQLTELKTSLTSQIKSCEELLNEKEMSHEKQIESLTRFKIELEARFETAEKEIEILKDLNAEQKCQLIEFLEETDSKDIRIEELESQVKLLQEVGKESKASDGLQSEVKRLQDALSINKNLLAEQLSEQANKQATIDTLNAQIIDLYKTMEENATKVLEKDDEIAYIQELFDSNKAELEKMISENKKLSQELHSQLISLEQLPGLKSESIKQEEKIQNLHKEIQTLEQKNKEQMDKLKKFAANLKKKTLLCTELEQKLKSGSVSKIVNEESIEKKNVKLQEHITQLSAELSSLKNQEPQVSFAEFEQLQANNNHLERENNLLNEEISRLSQELSRLNAKCDENRMVSDHMAQEIESLQKNKINSEEMLSRLSSGLDGLRSQIDVCHKELKEKDSSLQQQSEEIRKSHVKIEKCKAIIKEKNAQIQKLKDGSSASHDDNELAQKYQALLEEKKVFEETISKLETLHHGIQAKLEEDMNYIESIENENANYKDKICRLEECIATFEERRSSMERKVNLLDCQLQSKTDEFQKNEDQLIYRLNMLSDHDDIIAQRLLACQEEKEDLSEKLQKLKEEHSELSMKYNKLEKEAKTSEVSRTDNESLETENQSLREQLSKVEVDMNKIRAACKAKLLKSRTEMEEMENELSEQLRIVEEEKRALKEQLERSQDQSTELKDDVVRLNETISSLEESKTELERVVTWTRMQNDNMNQDQYEIQELRMQVMQEKTENENLKRQIESLIQNHEYEMNGLRTQISELDALRAQVGQNQTDDQQAILSENKRLKDLLKDRDVVIENYQRQNLQLQMNSFMMGGNSQPQDPFASLSLTSQADDSMELEFLREKVRKLEEDKLRLEAAVQSDNSLEISGLERAIQSLEGQLSAVELEKATLKESLEEELKCLKASNEILKAELNKLKDEDLQKAREEYQKLYDELQSSNKHRDQLKVDSLNQDLKIQKLTSELEGFSNLQQDLEKVKEERDEAMRLLDQNQVDEVRQAMLQDELLDLRQRAHLFDNQEQQHQREMQELSASFRDTNLEQQVLELTLKLQEAATNNDLLKQKDEELQAGKKEIDVIVEKNRNLESQLIQICSENSEMSEKLKMFEGQVSSFNDKIKSTFGEMQNLQTAYEEKLKEKCQENEKLLEEINRLMSSNNEIQQQFLATQQEVGYLNSRLEEVSKAPAVNPIMSAFGAPEASPFDEIVPVKKVSFVEANPHASNSSHLEKKIQELDQQLQSLTILHQETIRQMNESERMYENLLSEAEQKEKSLENKLDLLRDSEQKIKSLEDKLKDLECQKNVESLIVPTESMAPALSSFFSQETPETKFLPGTSTCVEPPIHPEKSYLCGPEHQQDPEALNLDLGDDWSGWAGEEAVQKVTTVQSLLSPRSQLEIKLQEQEEKIQELTAEKRILEEQKQELQSKSGKLMKKLKEYKTKIDGLNSQTFRKSSSIESNELDLAIQEELKSQVKQLEEKLEEVKKCSEKEGAEKEHLNKKLDVLTSANERMVEMKERQDLEVQMYKNQIRDLNEKLSTLGNWDEQTTPVKTLQDQGSSNEGVKELTTKINELNSELNDLRVDKDELQALLDESNLNLKESEIKVKHLQEKLLALEQNQTSEVSEMVSESNEMKIANQNLRETIAELEDSLSTLRASKSQAESKLEEIKANNANIESLKVEIERLKAELVSKSNNASIESMEEEIEILKMELASKSKEIEKIKKEHENQLQTIEEDFAVKNPGNQSQDTLKQKEAEIDHLKEKMQEKEAEIEHLHHRCEELQQEDQTAKLVLEILSKNQEIHILKMQNKHLEEEKTELEHNLTLQISQEMELKKQASGTLDSNKVVELEKIVSELKEEKLSMEEELKVLNDHVLSALGVEDKLKQLELVLKMKEMEISDLKIRLAQPKLAEGTETDQTYWEAVVEQKCAEIANSWRAHLEEREKQFKEELEKLSTSKEGGEASAFTGNESKLLEALQNQEIEIVTLKEQLAIRSAEYASLAARYDPYQEKGLGSPEANRRSASTGDSKVVPKSELDLAMYMLHQRDMRCEELTLEVVHLLEERDTLQLKLSNTIRQVEHIKERTGLTDDQINIELPPVDQASAVNVPEREGIESSPSKRDELKDKLTQLQSMSYNRDKNFKEERDERIRQMERIQQDVANIPQQAVSQLVGTDLSQTSQSPSSVLLNWLWGKPTSSSDQQS